MKLRTLEEKKRRPVRVRMDTTAFWVVVAFDWNSTLPIDVARLSMIQKRRVLRCNFLSTS